MRIQKISFLAVTGILTTLSCFAQGGGSVNGPDLKGVMISSEADGEILAEKASEAITQCYKMMGEKVLENILGRKVKLGLGYGQAAGRTYNDLVVSSSTRPTRNNRTFKEPYYSTTEVQTPDLAPREGDTLGRTPIYVPTGYNAYFALETYPVAEPSTGVSLFFKYGFSYKNTAFEDSLSIMLRTFEHFPVISYSLNNKSVYGELGQLISKKAFVSDLRFEPSATRVFKLQAIREDGVMIPTNITVNLDTLANCIRYKLTE